MKCIRYWLDYFEALLCGSDCNMYLAGSDDIDDGSDHILVVIYLGAIIVSNLSKYVLPMSVRQPIL